MRIMASLTKAATVRAYRSKSRAKRRLRLIQARVRFTLGQDDEFVQPVALDDLEHPTTGAGSRSHGAWSLIAGIGKDAKGNRQRVRRSRTSRAPSRS